jgi:hypothetical protein
LWRRYCQTFSTGFSSGAREGRKKVDDNRVVLDKLVTFRGDS